MVRALASQLIDLGFITLVESYRKTLKNGIYSLPAWSSAFMGGCGEQAVLSLGKALNGTPTLCGRQVTGKWQLPSECGLTVQNKAIHRFLVNGG